MSDPESGQETTTWRLRVSADGRRLEKADGSPWFWLGDTAWDLFIRPTREELERYFADRRDKGFTVIQGVVLMGYHVEFNEANAYGHRPFLDNDPTRPALSGDGSADFWTHADFVIDRARHHGLYVGLLPTWGYHVGGLLNTPVSFTPAQARTYADWIARRYRDRPNIIWINGGDVVGNEHGGADVAVWRAVGETIKAADADHLMTFHPGGRHSSSENFHDHPWLDFNMVQSGHSAFAVPNYDFVAGDYARAPVKPTLDGEPCYEDHPVRWNPKNGFFVDFDVRRAAYWSLFAGAFGHTYGHVNLWRFNIPGLVRSRERFQMKDQHWEVCLNSPGGRQMTHVRNLMLSRPAAGRVPDQSLLAANADDEGHLRATRGDGYAFVYTPLGRPVEADLSRLPWTGLACSWFDPRTGTAAAVGDPGHGRRRTFTPPGRPGRGNDWVLVIDDAARGYPPPGTASGKR